MSNGVNGSYCPFGDHLLRQIPTKNAFNTLPCYHKMCLYVNALATHRMRRGRVTQRGDLRAWGFSFTVQFAVSHAYILPDFDSPTPFYRSTEPCKVTPKIYDPWLEIFSPMIYLWRQWNPLLLLRQNGALVFEACSQGPQDCSYTGPSSSGDCFPHLQLFIHCPVFSFKIDILVIPCLLDDRLEMKDKDWLTHFKRPLPVNLIKSISSTSHAFTPWD